MFGDPTAAIIVALTKASYFPPYKNKNAEPIPECGSLRLEPGDTATAATLSATLNQLGFKNSRPPSAHTVIAFSSDADAHRFEERFARQIKLQGRLKFAQHPSAWDKTDPLKLLLPQYRYYRGNEEKEPAHWDAPDMDSATNLAKALTEKGYSITVTPRRALNAPDVFAVTLRKDRRKMEDECGTDLNMGEEFRESIDLLSGAKKGYVDPNAAAPQTPGSTAASRADAGQIRRHPNRTPKPRPRG